MRKRSASTGALIPYQVCYYSSMFTGWKRVYVERDKMFRRGGLLYAEDAQHMTVASGASSLKIYKGPSGTQLDNLSIGDKIAIFDSTNTFEANHDEAYVGSIDRTSEVDYATITLVTSKGGATPYLTKYSYVASPKDAASHYPDFSQGRSAGIGVIESDDGVIYDTSSNQINGAGSAFYDADMRAIQKTFNDAFVEFIGLRDGMGAVPYVAEKAKEFMKIMEEKGWKENGKIEEKEKQEIKKE